MSDQFDPVAFGQAVAATIREALAPLQRRIEELESRQPEKGERGEDGQDGQSVTVEDVAPLVEQAVKEAVAALPKPKDGEPGRDGKDAEPTDVQAIEDAVVTRLLASDRLDTLADLKAAEAVAKHFAENPVRDGKDGRDGADATPEQIAAQVRNYLAENPPPKGEPGKDGRDGLDIKDMLRSHEGHLIAVMSDGTTRDLGVFVGKDGAPGKDGKDGADFSEVEFDYDGERTLSIRGKGGEIVKRLPIPMDKGYYRDGMDCQKGDIVTHDGIAWIALRDTKAKPSISAKEDWRIFARKGRDGKDGRNGIDKTATVKVDA